MSKQIIRTNSGTQLRNLRNIDSEGHFAQVTIKGKSVNVYEVYLSDAEDFTWVTMEWMKVTALKFTRLDDED